MIKSIEDAASVVKRISADAETQLQTAKRFLLEMTGIFLLCMRLALHTHVNEMEPADE